MSEQTTPEQRRSFFEQHRDGKSYHQIADAARMSVMCVRYWCRRLRDGKADHSTYKRRPSGLLQSFHPMIRYVVLRMRLEHPRWGPQAIRLHLGKRPSLAGLRVPSVASIGYYLHQWPTFRRPLRLRTPTPQPNAPTQVHEEWQIDYKMAIPTADGHLVNLVDIRDPVGAAVIGSFVHLAGESSQRCRYLTFPQLRRDLRLCFARWQTLPDRIQTDNEAVFIGKPHSNFPSPFVLWLTGLGIAHVGIRPGRPTDNAEVERQHRTVNDYSLVGCTTNAATLQTVLDQSLHELNQEVPSRAHGCHGQPPLHAHPELLQPRRPFSADLELDYFALARVDAYMATFTWPRKVGKKGQINLGSRQHKYSVGQAYAGQQVIARFDSTDRHMVFYDSHGTEIRRRPCRALSITALTGLDTWPDGVGTQQPRLPLDFTQG